MISNSLKMMVDANTAPVINSLSVTKNGTYTAPEGVDGYSPITVDVQEEPWEPLEDGYSNFWFELTNDTLSPWLNFSAKNNDAVIDWGDGTGEVALDTLTPTHTYSKAGKYVVKVKGATGMLRIHTSILKTHYYPTLIYAELNNEVTEIGQNTFLYCTALKEVDARYVATAQGYVFQYCASLKTLRLDNLTTWGNGICYVSPSLRDIVFANTITDFGSSLFYMNVSLSAITIPATVTSIGNGCFQYCAALVEIHIQATTPPTLGTNVFTGIPSNYIIYVPVGTGDTYKAASGWSTYADHILEEGQTRSRAMLSKSEDTLTDEPNTPEER